MPLSATVRFLPLGRSTGIQPYVGVGIGVINWRYTETGEFVDFNDEVFRANFTAKGNEVGPVILGGLRFPVSDVWLVGGEVRWHSAEGKTGGIDEVFSRQDRSRGWTTNFTVHFDSRLQQGRDQRVEPVRTLLPVQPRAAALARVRTSTTRQHAPRDAGASPPSADPS